jgi:hypothetical protein
MTYILVIWTIVAGGVRLNYSGGLEAQRDWRPIGEFYNSPSSGKNAQQMCEDAARQLAINPDKYSCVRSK